MREGIECGQRLRGRELFIYDLNSNSNESHFHMIHQASFH